ncbi:MAG: O-antigen ligase family protein [Chloroflexi bacterium]|nr:O-antigen ligase family protein [Chloroflexota bacterium]
MIAELNQPPANSTPRWRRAAQRLAWLEPFWVAAIGIVVAIPPRFLPAILQPTTSFYRMLLVAGLALGWPLRLAAYKRFTQRTPLDWPLLLLLVWLPVNYWASADKAASWDAISYLVFGIAAYFALVNWPPAQRQPKWIAWPILLYGAGLTLTAPLISDLATGKLFAVPIVDQVFQQLTAQVPGNINANRIAGMLVVVLPLYVALAVRPDWKSRRWLRLACGLLALAMTGVLILTRSRNGYLAAAAALTIILLVRWPRLLRVLPICLLAGAISLYFIGPRVVLEELSSGDLLNGLDGRLELWSRGLYALSDFPFTGIGIGTFDRVIPVLYPLFTIGSDIQGMNAHNLFIQIGLDLGLPGLIAYLALSINTVVLLAQVLRKRAAALDWALAAGALGGLVAMFVHGIFDAPLWGSKAAFLPWLLMALAVRVGL